MFLIRMYIKMTSGFFIKILVILMVSTLYTFEQIVTTSTAEVTTAAESDSKIKGPLVTLHEDSFAEILLVLLQSQYHNNKAFVLDSQSATETVLGVNLFMQFEGTMTLKVASVQKVNVEAHGNSIHVFMNVPALQVNKTYSVTSGVDPDYSSKGYATLENEGMILALSMSYTQIQYYVNGVIPTTSGNMSTSIHGQGIPLAEEVQEAVKNMVINQFIIRDATEIHNDVRNKLRDIFDNNQLILCLSCEYSYCRC